MHAACIPHSAELCEFSEQNSGCFRLHAVVVMNPATGAGHEQRVFAARPRHPSPRVIDRGRNGQVDLRTLSSVWFTRGADGHDIAALVLYELARGTVRSALRAARVGQAGRPILHPSLPTHRQGFVQQWMPDPLFSAAVVNQSRDPRLNHVPVQSRDRRKGDQSVKVRPN
jgi:hypothetical protein